jgi:ATP-binding cassette subfamily B protein
LLVAAPITAIGGVLALREDVGLSAILLVSIPALLVIVSSIISRMVPRSA